MKISIGEVPPSNGSDKHSKKSSWNVLNVAVIIKTVQQPQDIFAGHGAGVPPLPCLAVPTDIGNQPPPIFTDQNR